MPALWLLLGILICGLKFPFDLLRGENTERYEYLAKNQWGLRSGDPEIESDLKRIRDPGRTSHDLTALAISVGRWGLHDQRGQEGTVNTGPGFVKGISAAIVWPWIIFFAFKIIKLFW